MRSREEIEGDPCDPDPGGKLKVKLIHAIRIQAGNWSGSMRSGSGYSREIEADPCALDLDTGGKLKRIHAIWIRIEEGNRMRIWIRIHNTAFVLLNFLTHLGAWLKGEKHEVDPGAGVAGLHRVEGALVQAMVTASLYTHFLLQCPRIFYFSEGGGGYQYKTNF